MINRKADQIGRDIYIYTDRFVDIYIHIYIIWIFDHLESAEQIIN